jgi:hypothetical protein
MKKQPDEQPDKETTFEEWRASLTEEELAKEKRIFEAFEKEVEGFWPDSSPEAQAARAAHWEKWTLAQKQDEIVDEFAGIWDSLNLEGKDYMLRDWLGDYWDKVPQDEKEALFMVQIWDDDPDPEENE